LSFNGQIFRETQYRLDGNSNYDTLFNNSPLQRVSLSAVSEFRVLTNQFNAEHGSTSTGLVIATTRAGTDAWHGEALMVVRPSGIQARPPLTDRHIPNELLQGGASLGGPAKRGSVYVFGNYETLRQNRGSFVSSPVPGFFTGTLRDQMGLLRSDVRWSDRHWTMLRVNAQRETNTNPNDRVGGLVQPSNAARSIGQGIGGQLVDTATAGSTVNEFRAGYINSVPSSTVPLIAGVGILRPGYSTEGTSSFSSVRTEVYQAADQFSWQSGSHALKFGADFIRRKARDFSYDAFGSYTFAGGPPVPGQQPLQYSHRFGVALLTYGQTQWAGFLQDTWRVHPRVTLNVGLRYDYQSLVDDLNNFGPRFGFTWDAWGWVVRGGAGLFYDQPFFHGLTQRFLLNAVDAPFATYTLTPRDSVFPQFPASLDPLGPPATLTLAPRNIVVRGDELRSPYTSQFTLGLQRQMGDWILSVNAIRSLTVKQFIHYDRNAAAPLLRTLPGQVRTVTEADRTRPLYDPARGVSMYQGVAVRQVRQTENGGIARFHSLDLGVARRFSRRYQLAAHYVLSSALNSVTDDHLGANPNEWSDVVGGEMAVSDFAQRHRFVAHGTLELPWTVQLSAIATLASGLPVNAITGLDNNGDGTVVDRPAGFGRNTFRGTDHRSLDLSVNRTFSVSETVGVELRADAFNVLNSSNFYRFNNVYGNGTQPSASFLLPVGGVANADPGRQWTFGARLIF
ncbi:MAG TPA: hypothetical protein VES20_19815, partial [Bryobacteraceae bacterium]|nr:hypothetical protein [Bryobacteraceae bacterium]